MDTSFDSVRRVTIKPSLGYSNQLYMATLKVLLFRLTGLAGLLSKPFQGYTRIKKPERGYSEATLSFDSISRANLKTF